MTKSVAFIFFLIFASAIFLFKNSLNYYYLQDDWFVLNTVGKINSPSEFLSLFSFNREIIYYRPIGMFLFFLANKIIFGLNPIFFHLEIFLLHLLNAILISLIVFNLTKSKLSSLVSSFTFSTAAFHFMSLSWLSLSWNVIGTTFFLGAIYFYLTRGKYAKHISFLLFFLSILSTEFAVFYPAALILIEIFLKNKKVSNIKKINLLFFAITLSVSSTYILLRLFVFKSDLSGSYAPRIDLRILNSIAWYILWIFNLPEVLKYQMSLSNLSLSSDVTFLEPFKPFKIPISIAFSSTISSLAILAIKAGRIEIIKISTFALIFLLGGIMPVILLPNHTFPYYLSIPSIGVFIAMGFFIKSIKKNNAVIALITVLLSTWFLTSLLSTQFTRKTHWITAEEIVSERITKKALSTIPNLPENSKVIIFPASDHEKQSLMDQNALQVVYGDATIETIYRKTLPEDSFSGFSFIDLR